MSFDVAVWAGPMPADDRAAAAEWGRRLRAQEAGPRREPTAQLVRFVEALLRRWPDLGTPGDDDSPWASGPLLDDVDGDVGHLTLVWSRAQRGAVFVANTAAAHGLVCFDPQSEMLMTPVDESVLDEPPAAPGPPTPAAPPTRRRLFRR